MVPSGVAELHHIGVITSCLEEAFAQYARFGYQPSPRFAQLDQGIDIILMERAGEPLVELVQPVRKDSHATGWLDRIKAGPYHLGYRTLELETTVACLRADRFLPVAEPFRALAFGLARVQFLFNPLIGLLELVEIPRAMPARDYRDN